MILERRFAPVTVFVIVEKHANGEESIIHTVTDEGHAHLLVRTLRKYYGRKSYVRPMTLAVDLLRLVNEPSLFSSLVSQKGSSQ